MYDHDLSPFLREVLEAVRRHAANLTVDPAGEPDGCQVDRLSGILQEKPEDVRMALLGLRADHCLLENSVEFDGITPFVWWTVHPQCVN